MSPKEDTQETSIGRSVPPPVPETMDATKAIMVITACSVASVMLAMTFKRTLYRLLQVEGGGLDISADTSFPLWGAGLTAAIMIGKGVGLPRPITKKDLAVALLSISMSASGAYFGKKVADMVDYVPAEASQDPHENEYENAKE